jgi:sRNA-binding carbon storage regulator CsrA
MLLFVRRVGQSLIIRGDHLITLSTLGFGEASITLTSRQAPDAGVQWTLHVGEWFEVVPEVRCALAQALPDRAVARLALDAPRDVPIYRKEVFDTLHGADPEGLGGPVHP